MDVCAENYTLKELRAWLLALNQPASGNKATLALRLSSISAENRGVCPRINNDDDVNNNDNNNNDNDNINNENNNNDDVNNTNDSDNSNNENDNDDTTNARNKDATGSTGENDENANNVSGIVNECVVSVHGVNENNHLSNLQNIEKELQLIKKERDLLLKQNELLKTAATSKQINTKMSENDSTTSFRMLKEFIPEFDGTSNVNIWTGQLKSLGETYKLDSNTLRALLMTKLRGKAQKWLYAMPNYATVEVEGLLSKLKELFDTKESQMILRRKLEERKWQYDENFSQYMYEKTLLATEIKIGENELVDYIIDGIPDINLRTQAHMLCLTTKKQLSDAYSKVKLQKPQKTHERTVVGTQKDTEQRRCFNCNSFGHMATDCKKPKRDPGSCYGCGSMQHRVLECPQRKKPILTIHAENDFEDYNAS